MRRQELGGALLFNVSKQALNPEPGFGAYGASKAALLALMRQYAWSTARRACAPTPSIRPDPLGPSDRRYDRCCARAIARGERDAST